ncbi:MAG TPA: hypothetical protein VK194_01165 [Candidatus Deferrimicrobium sp.]|nr:hypothetical protein [Candidatus Deferrimicrobium sp.]
MSVVRVFTFRTVRPGFDSVVRGEMMPEMRSMSGLVEVFFGRQGPNDVGPRILVSIWSSTEAMVAGVGDRLGVFHPECLSATSDHVLEVFEHGIGDRVEGPPPTILRVFRGVVRPGELDAYVEDVRDGVEHDRRDEVGPIALYLGATDDGAFVTASAWREWDDIARSTGGDIHEPNKTRHPERLESWSIEHFEIVR